MVSATAVIIVLVIIVIGLLYFKPKMFSGTAPSVIAGGDKKGTDKLASQIRDLANEINSWMPF